MKPNKLPIILAILALVVSVLACSSTAKVNDAWLATDEEGNSKTTTFSPSDTFHLFVELNAFAPKDTELKAAWIAVQAEGTDPNFLIKETNYTSSGGTIHFKLSFDGQWPAGSYKVDVYLNGTLDRTLTFEVQ